MLWDKTKGAIKGVALVGISPVYLLSVDPRIRTLRDFGRTDKIPLPAVKVSTQALILQMAAANEFGLENHSKLDANTVGMGHPDAVTMLSTGNTEVKRHVSAPPYQQLELKNGATKNSRQLVFGGPHDSAIVYAPVKFRETNPRTYKAFVQA